MGVFVDHVKKAAEKKNLSPEEWLMEIAKKAEKCCFATHVGRFTNPDVKIIYNAENVNSKRDSPYVTTSSSNALLDAVASSASFLPALGLLFLKLEDGKTVYEHLISDEEDLQKDIQDFEVDYYDFKDAIFSIGACRTPRATDEKLCQVYFPAGVGEGYHLLSVLPPSSVMLELKERILARNKEDAEKRKNEIQIDRSRWMKLVQTKFGGTKPQNVSYRNAATGGRLFMIQSMPPTIEKKSIFYPRKDFFSENLWLKEFTRLFYRLHGRYKDTRHNAEIRQSVRDVEAQIMEKVLVKVYKLRQGPEGWSDSRSLSTAQAIWLDEKYAFLRWERRWRQEIADSFAAWMFSSYQKVMKEKSVELGNGEFQALSEEFRKFLEDEMKEVM